jgi:hypothetical protein
LKELLIRHVHSRKSSSTPFFHVLNSDPFSFTLSQCFQNKIQSHVGKTDGELV